MCLLVVRYRPGGAVPLLVAANRDEWFARPSTPMGVLRASGPRILGGRDLKFGGTWLAVNERGVVAALTNVPGGADDTLLSRGELPKIAAAERSASDGALAVVRAATEQRYRPCWFMVADRDSLHYIDLSVPGEAKSRALEPGLWVLENRPLDAASAKGAAIRSRVAEMPEDAPIERYKELMSQHVIDSIAPPTDAVCVHTENYGTRSTTVVRLDAGSALPQVWSSNGPPCVTPLREASAWDPGGTGEGRPGGQDSRPA